MHKIVGILCLIFCFSIFQGWAEIKAVIFEFEGVMATVDRDLITDFVATSFKVSHAQALELQAKWQQRLQKGEDEYDFLLKYARSHGLSSSQGRLWFREWDRVNAIAVREIPGMQSLVHALGKRGLTTVLFSNMTALKARRVGKSGCLDQFDPIFLSYRLGVEKPNLKAYKLVLGELALSPDSCLLVDDQLENVQAALESGMDAILFTNPANLVEEFNQRGIEVRVRSIPKAQHVAS